MYNDVGELMGREVRCNMKMYATISIFISALTCCPTCTDFSSSLTTSDVLAVANIFYMILIYGIVSMDSCF